MLYMHLPQIQSLLQTTMPDILPGAHDFVLNNSTVIANAGLTRPGLELLLEKSMRDAFHDSSARWPPPLCHPGTRQDYIEKLTGWGIGALGQQIFWMHGPAGVGKSAVAQSCANFFAARKKLGAAVFLSRPNGRNDPDRFFTSISYQLAIRVESYGDHLDHRIQRNPTIITKSIAEQFQELLVNPISQLRAEGVDIGEWLIIIDGLDECGGKDGGDGKAEKYARDIQCDIVEMAAASVREGVLPFRWVFLSRPETHIVSSFTANNMRRISYHLELPVTRAIDNEIRLYLTDELQKIRERSGLPDTWPPAHEIATLVNVSAGLWIYPATLVRFIRDPDSSPVDQLDAVLALFKEGNGRTSSGHPLMELDLFYTLIMRRVPSRILPVVQRILLLFESSSMAVSQPFDWVKFGEVVNRPIVKVLGLSELQFENACSSLRAVLKFNPLSRLGITFYHASFMEFLADATRSNKFCVYSYLNPLRRELVERLSDVHARSTTGMASCASCALHHPHHCCSSLSDYRCDTVSAWSRDAAIGVPLVDCSLVLVLPMARTFRFIDMHSSTLLPLLSPTSARSRRCPGSFSSGRTQTQRNIPLICSPS
ncbi:hypothetical protein P691DRAFT_701940 [Macrolepiota fuliginosa MF-IS2]|uniref:Nephrocystin 3-like N-terminal domain-containing protein n=1 Tax=Macrolepiota fuliginosa MF-IS2 TaxID=1400762 RepID=A0A9P5XGW1_9AGAR|nr:hypothetical protein P691DRAFT_701940 [Macrolepiota fuliginosa MF-IS2]